MVDLTTRDLLEQDAHALRVPLRNATPSDSWFIDNLVYGIAQELEKARERVAVLESFYAEAAAQIGRYS